MNRHIAPPYISLLCLALAFCARATFAAPNPANETLIVFSIDTETTAGCGPAECTPGTLDRWILGHHDGGTFGIGLMMDILERYNARGTFFVNAYLDAHYPEEDIKPIVKQITDRGHDTQLHTHAEFRCFKSCRPTTRRCWDECTQEQSFMAKNTLDNQIALLREGAANIERWSGKYPVAFRGGGFDADETTIEALARIGIRIDSSLNGPTHALANVFDANRLSSRYGVLEVPLTAYAEELPGHRSYRFLDVESSTFDEFRSILESPDRPRVVMVLMHSISFCRPQFNCPNSRNINRFDAMVKHASSRLGTRVVTLAELWNAYASNQAAFVDNENRSLPSISYWQVLQRSAERFSDGWKNQLFLLGNIGLALLLVVFVGWALRQAMRRMQSTR